MLCIACNWLKQQYVNVYKKQTGKKPDFVITSEMAFKQFGRPAQLQTIPELACKQCEQNEMARQAQEQSVLQGRPRNEITKMQLFMDILHDLQGDMGNPAEHETLIKAMVDAGKFTADDAPDYIRKLCRDGIIYQRWPGHYSKT